MFDQILQALQGAAAEQGTLRSFLGGMASGQAPTSPNPFAAAEQGSVRAFLSQLGKMGSPGASLPTPEEALAQFNQATQQKPASTPAPSATPSIVRPAATFGGTSNDYANIGDPADTSLPPHARAFLNAVAAGESGGKYDVRYTPTGGARFTDLSAHPRIYEAGPAGPSSAAGRYQEVYATHKRLGGGTMEPIQQDQRAWKLAQEDYQKRTGRDLLVDLQEQGLTPQMMATLQDTWSSFKGRRDKWSQVYQRDLERFQKENAEGMEFSSSKGKGQMPLLLNGEKPVQADTEGPLHPGDHEAGTRAWYGGIGNAIPDFPGMARNVRRGEVEDERKTVDGKPNPNFNMPTLMRQEGEWREEIGQGVDDVLHKSKYRQGWAKDVMESPEWKVRFSEDFPAIARFLGVQPNELEQLRLSASEFLSDKYQNNYRDVRNWTGDQYGSEDVHNRRIHEIIEQMRREREQKRARR